MYLWKTLVLVTSLVLAAGAHAETREVLLTEGDWTAYRAEGVVVDIDQTTLDIASACIAETKHSDGLVRLMAFDDNDLITQLSSEVWSFPRRKANMRIKWGKANVTYGDTEYIGDTVQHWNLDNATGVIRVLLFFTKESETQAHVFDENDTELAEFSMDGFTEALSSVQSCAGSN